MAPPKQFCTLRVTFTWSANSNTNVTSARLKTDAGSKWTATTGRSPRLSTVTADGSVVFQSMQSDNAMHVSIADPNGNITPLFANPADGSDLGPAIPIPYDPDFLQLNTASYWTLGTWHASLSDGGLAAVLGHVSFIAIDAAPQAGGGSAKQNSPKIPEIAHFVPVSAQTLGIDPQELLRQIKEDLPQPGKAIHYPFLGPDATVEKFTTTLAKPLSTVGFIGQSVDFSNAINNQIVVYSVGLLLADKRLVAPPSDDPQYPVPPYENAVVAERIKTQ